MEMYKVVCGACARCIGETALVEHALSLGEWHAGAKDHWGRIMIGRRGDEAIYRVYQWGFFRSRIKATRRRGYRAAGFDSKGNGRAEEQGRRENGARPASARRTVSGEAA